MWIRSSNGQKLVNTDRIESIEIKEWFDQKEFRTKYTVTAFSDNNERELETCANNVDAYDTIGDIFLAMQHQCDTYDI